MQKCYNCGKEVDDNVPICPDCGALVKRYGKPVPVEPDSYHQQPQPDAYPGAYEAPAQPGPRERVWLDAAGKPHFKGALCFWLIVCAVFAGYLLFGFGCMLLIYHAQGFFLDALAAFPEFSDLTDVLNLMLESIGTYYAFYVAVPVLFAVKLFGIVWLLVSKRRLAFYIALGAGVLLTVTKSSVWRQRAGAFIHARYAAYVPASPKRLAQAASIKPQNPRKQRFRGRFSYD
ncbi:MAG: hypothetical protein V8S92_08265 [Oscillospiraceae bacterium]